jgi:hypothetical protein
MERDKHFLVGVFDDEDVVSQAVTKIRDSGVNIYEVYSPFPVHGLEDRLGYKRSFLPKAAFSFGLLGTTLALTMMFWMMGYDWPMIIGGKNFTSLPPFIPVTFELTVLLAALGMVGTFMITCDLKPYKKPRLFDPRCTDDKHIMAVDIADNKLDKAKISEILAASGAIEVNEKDYS